MNRVPDVIRNNKCDRTKHRTTLGWLALGVRPFVFLAPTPGNQRHHQPKGHLNREIRSCLPLLGFGSLECFERPQKEELALNSELLKRATEKVRNPNVLVNLVSKRVRQLNGAGGAGSRPLLSDTTGLGVADIALAELCEEKMSWEALELLEAETGPAKKRRRPV